MLFPSETKTLRNRLIDNMLDGSIGINVEECLDWLVEKFGERYDLTLPNGPVTPDELKALVGETIAEVEAILAREAKGDFAGWAETVDGEKDGWEGDIGLDAADWFTYEAYGRIYNPSK